MKGSSRRARGAAHSGRCAELVRSLPGREQSRRLDVAPHHGCWSTVAMMKPAVSSDSVIHFSR